MEPTWRDRMLPAALLTVCGLFALPTLLSFWV